MQGRVSLDFRFGGDLHTHSFIVTRVRQRSRTFDDSKTKAKVIHSYLSIRWLGFQLVNANSRVTEYHCVALEIRRITPGGSQAAVGNSTMRSQNCLTVATTSKYSASSVGFCK